MKSAPRLDLRLVRAIAKLDDPARPIAETRRRVGSVADSLGLPRPSYERVRQLVHLHRQAAGDPNIGRALLDLAFNTRGADRVVADLLTADRRHSEQRDSSSEAS
jgi:hypothetical protein